MSGTDRPHIFCVNGSPEFLEILRYFFEDEQFSVTTTNGMLGPFDQIAGLKPDLLLIDLVFGQKRGWELLEQLQADAITNGIPVIVTSTDHRLLDRAQQDQARYGGELFLVKPLDLEELLDGVHMLLGPRWRIRD